MGEFNWLFRSKKDRNIPSGEEGLGSGVIAAYRERLQEAGHLRDVNSFVSIYVEARQNRIDVADEATKVLVAMGKTSVEAIATMLNDRSRTVEFRGTVAHLLMTALSSHSEVGNTSTTKNELRQALSDKDFFVSGNAAEALIPLGIKEISGVSVREYARNIRTNRLGDEMDRLFGR
jgi:hypothetical protein